ncbi:MAG TPA: ABC transporter permease [Acidobacteriaceae bacterium]|nr:ABC transporter permease [Acidobacteriaceae bacterium]
MEFREAIKVALQSLWANKMRTILTMIGVIIGVASVIAVITLSNGAKMYVVQKIANHGSDTLTVTRLNPVIFSGEEFLRENKRKYIYYDDYAYLQRTCTRCLVLGADISTSGTVVNGKQSTTNTTISGWTSDMFEINDLNVVEGRALTPMDDRMGTHSIVVGYDIVDNLLPNIDPIGQELRVDGEVYTIVGVGEKKGSVFGQSEDNYVDMPLSTYLHTHGQNESIDISAKAGTAPGALDNAIDEVRALMRARRHDAPGQEDSFGILTNDTFISLYNQIMGIFTTVIIGIASISLVVGGVVIMNIMLVSVTERTREIGVRKALGATQRDVLLQFLIEAVIMALIGGFIGVGLGIGVAKGVTSIVGFPSSVAIWAVLLGLFVAAGVGIFFGVYPARKAAMLDPIVALRAEL